VDDNDDDDSDYVFMRTLPWQVVSILD